MRKRQRGSMDICDCLKASGPGSCALSPGALGVCPSMGRLTGAHRRFKLTWVWAGLEASMATSKTSSSKYYVLGGYR
ncbi:hypothetical protein E2562_007478 [Oryza meyeriana var. granulata]|uniref:Uncharacterized protein n=1 Tax=Oryza meyeriana var. granulata TaxID=110450 RepID=A0A6G1F4Y6_9ORYZ|nr:hypothetical protein E2562_007478 [Oryza meyeriana var. granulata]